jgi:hypothetical protein
VNKKYSILAFLTIITCLFFSCSALAAPTSCTVQATTAGKISKSIFCSCYLKQVEEACNWNVALKHSFFPFHNCNTSATKNAMVNATINSLKSAFNNNPTHFCQNPINQMLTPCDPNDTTGTERCTVNSHTYLDSRGNICSTDTATLLKEDACVAP